jgi:hypothetical protein
METELRRSLRLLFVIRLHDRHGAHLTLEVRLKQPGQSLQNDLGQGDAEAFSYTRTKPRSPPRRRAFSVSISLRDVTQNFQLGNYRGLTAN